MGQAAERQARSGMGPLLWDLCRAGLCAAHHQLGLAWRGRRGPSHDYGCRVRMAPPWALWSVHACCPVIITKHFAGRAASAPMRAQSPPMQRLPRSVICASSMSPKAACTAVHPYRAACFWVSVGSCEAQHEHEPNKGCSRPCLRDCVSSRQAPSPLGGARGHWRRANYGPHLLQCVLVQLHG